MQHDDLAGQAQPCRAAIAEGLHAAQRHPDRVGVVAMRIEGAAVKPRLDALHPRGVASGDDAVFSGIGAQTSKTLEGLAV